MKKHFPKFKSVFSKTHRRKLHEELRRNQSGEGELLCAHAMRAEAEAEKTGRPLQEALADFPPASKPLIPVSKIIGPDGRVVYVRRPQ